MCGIAGIISHKKIELPVLREMTDIIAHRGPDGDGHWINDAGNIGLGHRRLSIIDLSHEADQPMHYLDRYTIVFNGEIYNYLELKDTLVKQGYAFKTASDTEVLMALYDRDKKNCLQLLDGMFSFVIYDAKENEIFVARDRFGEKPFFYSYEKGSHFIFGSEMKCLWAAGVKKEVNDRMLYNYLNAGNIENPDDISETFYKNCTRLPHGHCITISIPGISITIEQYYDINWRDINYSITREQASERLHELFYTSVKRRLRSDVTVGSSLSGGLDSSLVVTVIDELKKGTAQKQDTFSAVFPGFIKDERKYMDYVINKTNVSPHFVTPDDEGLIKNLEKLSWHQEEPYGSASIYVQYCVMKMAKENNVTVLLDGQGADEILAGYHHYYTRYFHELSRRDPKRYKQEVSAYESMHANSNINADVRTSLFHKIKLQAGESLPTMRKWYHQFQERKNPVFNADFLNIYNRSSFDSLPIANSLNQTLYQSTMKMGLQELLRYADRNSMAHSREVRLPFLYHELVEFLFSLPPDMKINNGWTKWIMRKTFEKELPAEICWRKDKIGYEPPQQNWLGNKMIQEKIVHSKEKLIAKDVLSKSINNTNKWPKEKLNSRISDWRFLLAYELI